MAVGVGTAGASRHDIVGVDAMDEKALRGLVARVRAGRMSRRAFVHKMVGLGLTAPLAWQMLAHSGVARAATAFDYRPTKRGGGGALKVLWWQAPTLLNPHFAVGTKDQDACRIFYEPLAAWDPEGNLVPILAAELPDLEKGTLAHDGKSVTWKIKPDVKWHDGTPLSADDLVFTWEYATDPKTAAVSIGTYTGTTVEKVDDLTVTVHFENPTPFWANPFVGQRGSIIPKHQFGAYKGDKSRDAPANLKPVGTGPYRFVSFTPGDLVRGEINSSYHAPNQPYFDTIEMKGGGDAVSAARAVLQTGEYDYAWNLQVEDEVLKRAEAGGKGRVDIAQGGDIEHLQLNGTDPWTEVDGERASIKTRHPLLSDTAVREALAHLVDRESVQKFIYGRTGIASGDFLNNPPRYRSKSPKAEFNLEKANAILDAGGWKRGADGIRAKDGKRLKFVFQTSINAPRQKTQAVIKQACQKAGIEIELKSVTASVFFSSDVANTDTYTKFYCDMQMYNTTMPWPDPQPFMDQFLSWQVADKNNKWQGRNVTRWTSDDYDKAYRAAMVELDPVKRAALFIQMNDLVCTAHNVIPIVNRPKVQAIGNNLRCMITSWDNDLSHLASWYRET
jgi:peptide/nickel transport system substrate-binding protein